MKLGFLTACLPGRRLDEIVEWASKAGFSALEVAAWPPGAERDHTACHLDVRNLNETQATQIKELFTRHDLTLPTLGYYENNMHHDPMSRGKIHDHLRRCIDAAALLDVHCVGTFIGRDVTLSVADNAALAETLLPPLVNYATERGVRLAIENCPMPGWHPDGYPANLAYSPELWEWMFELGFYLNFDPSHLVWLGIDPIDILRRYVGRVVHVQAKDIEIDPSKRSYYGVFGKTLDRTDPWDLGWWRYRIPGRGDIDWRRLVDTLHEHGYDGTVSIEHEDPIWSGTETRVKNGLTIAYETLRTLARPVDS